MSWQLRAKAPGKVGAMSWSASIRLPARTRSGLGGIAKGYGVDRAMQVLMDHGIEHGGVRAGSHMKVPGTEFGEPWRIAVKHPRDRDSRRTKPWGSW